MNNEYAMQMNAELSIKEQEELDERQRIKELLIEIEHEEKEKERMKYRKHLENQLHEEKVKILPIDSHHVNKETEQNKTKPAELTENDGFSLMKDSRIKRQDWIEHNRDQTDSFSENVYSAESNNFKHMEETSASLDGVTYISPETSPKQAHIDVFDNFGASVGNLEPEVGLESLQPTYDDTLSSASLDDQSLMLDLDSKTQIMFDLSKETEQDLTQEKYLYDHDVHTEAKSKTEKLDEWTSQLVLQSTHLSCEDFLLNSKETEGAKIIGGSIFINRKASSILFNFLTQDSTQDMYQKIYGYMFICKTSIDVEYSNKSLEAIQRLLLEQANFPFEIVEIIRYMIDKEKVLLEIM